jgi:chemotaxis protein CheZ
MNLTLSRVLYNSRRLQGIRMPVRQKIFRIEKLQAGSHPSAAADATISADLRNELFAELKAIRELIEQKPAMPPVAPFEPGQITPGDLSLLKHEAGSIHRAVRETIKEIASLHFRAFKEGDERRASRELDAVADGTERATQQILAAAEEIDEAANTLSASLRTEQERALAGDIRDHIVRIFEACNFQDVSGQRISKVLEALQFVEDRVARMMEIWGGKDAVKDYAGAGAEEASRLPTLVNGPKLDDDPGHSSQQEIDAMFAYQGSEIRSQ